MIIDSFENIRQYEAVLPDLQKGLEAIRNADQLPVGNYPFEGGRFMIQEGTTKSISQGDFESHRKFIDVQIILSGCEEIAWQDVKNLTVTKPYDPEKDAAKYAGDKSHHILVSAGMFWAAFPRDGHRAVVHTGDVPHTYRKIVMKLPVKE